MVDKKIICPFCGSKNIFRKNKKMVTCKDCKITWSCPDREGMMCRIGGKGINPRK